MDLTDSAYLRTTTHGWLLALRALFLVCLTGLAVGSLLPSSFAPQTPLPQDKLLHFAGYALVAGLALAAIRHPRRQLITLLMLTALGVALEFGQTLVPGRAFEVADMVANGGGVWVVFGLHRTLL